MDDLISRQAAIEAIGEVHPLDYNGQAILERIKALPSAQPKTGHWYIDERPESNREVTCSNCEQPIFRYHKLDFDYRPKYCPNCGAKMF